MQITMPLQHFQSFVNAFANKTLSLAVNIKKNLALPKLPSNKPSTQSFIKMSNTILKNRKHFLYLGNLLSSKVTWRLTIA